MKRIIAGIFGCLVLALASSLLCAMMLAFARILLAAHVVTMLAGIGLVLANRTEIGLAVAGAPAPLFIGTFVVLNVVRDWVIALTGVRPY
jgi:predicted tellurium resistance membrane protein TerC